LIRRALSTPRRNDRGSIRFHLPIDASVDVTEARSLPRSNTLSASRLSTKSRLPGKLDGVRTDTGWPVAANAHASSLRLLVQNGEVATSTAANQSELGEQAQ